jgi:hypothetical protein
MIKDTALESMRHPRRQAPAPLLERLVEEARTGGKSLVVGIKDQLAPDHALQQRLAHDPRAFETMRLPSIADALRMVCYLAPPARVDYPICTMAPDTHDVSFDPKVILNQWRDVVDTSCDGSPWHSWRDAAFGAIDRVNGYRKFAQTSLVIRTHSDEPYANVWVTIDPSRSEPLKRIPAAAPPHLVAYLSKAGHGNGVVVVPESLAGISPFRGATIVSSASAEQVVSAIADLWEPDSYPKHPESVLQKGFGIYSITNAPSRCIGVELNNGWADPGMQQALSESDVRAVLQDDLIGLCVVTAGVGERIFVMTNGISGAHGGF